MAAEKYQWFADDKEIEGADEATLLVTADMVGQIISVKATAEDMQEATATCTEAVGVYEALEILSAEQTGEKEVEVTFSAPVGASDKITVTKGGNSVEIKSTIDSDKLGATLTFTDAITTGTYTVTLTPADTTVKASSVTFEGERSKVTEIVFLNDVLVMKNQYYNEGYAYIEGHDQFGNKKVLSGINVISGVGTFKSYDSATGKITIADTSVATPETTGAFLTIKEVPVFVQYQEGTQMVAANENLKVSTRAYLNEMEFGAIKKNSTETAKRLTLDELRSGLWYVEIENAKDQWGNALSADDLQDQADDHVLFVIPGDTGAFYKTGKFGKLNDKTVLWLDGDAASKPGTMDLTITGAGGNTFKKEAVEIFDNPYIDVLTVDYPDLYEGMTESKQLNFSAVDQYGDDIDLWDFVPAETADGAGANTILEFGDVNGMTGVHTTITVSGGPTFNKVEKDTKAKQFKVTLNVNGAAAKTMAVFTTTTAGTKVATRTVTIGERGNASVIANSFPSVKTLDPNGNWNVNADIEFVDVNGNVMTRNKNNTLYPYFINGTNLVGKVTNNALKNTDKPTRYVWTISNKKIENAASMATATFDSDGKIEVAAGNAADFYVTVFGTLDDLTYYIIDRESVRVSSKAGDIDKKEVVAPDTLYADPSSEHSVAFKVKLTNSVGESWKVDATSVSVGGIFADTTSGNTVKGNIATALPGNTTATVPVSVYYAGELVGTTNLTYTNVKPVATTTKFEYTAVGVGNNGTELGRTGVKFSKAIDGTEFTASAGDDYKIKDGKLTITGANSFGDTFEAWITDQYGVTMKDTSFYLNGAKLTSKDVAVPAGRNVWEFKNDTQGKAFYMTSNGAALDVTEYAAASVDTAARLNVAVAAATGNGKADTITFTGIDNLTGNVTIEEGDTLVIANGAAIDTNGNTLKIEGALTNNGTLAVDGDNRLVVGDGTSDVTVTNNGKVSLAGNMAVAAGNTTYDATTFTNNGNIEVTAAGKTITVNGKFVNKGTVEGSILANNPDVTGTGTWVNNSGSELDANTVNMTNANTLENAGTVIANTITGFVKVLDSAAVTDANTTYTAETFVPAGVKAAITIGANTLTIDNSKSTTVEADVRVESATAVTILNADAGDGTATAITSTAGNVEGAVLEGEILASGFFTDGSAIGTALDGGYTSSGSVATKAYNASDYNGVATSHGIWLLYTAPSTNKMVFVCETEIGDETYSWYEEGGSAKTKGNVYAYAESTNASYLSTNANAQAITGTLEDAETAMTAAEATGFNVTVKVYAADSYANIGENNLVDTVEIECKTT